MDRDPTFIRGRLHAPFFIYLKCGWEYDDRGLLDLFGLDDYEPLEKLQLYQHYAYLHGGDEWLMIADDWFYSLWHGEKTRDVLDDLGKVFEVLTFSVGDSDQSFDLHYYTEGKLRRRLVVQDPHYRGGEVVEDFGVPLPDEPANLMDAPNNMEILFGLADSLGIPTEVRREDLRFYGKDRAPRIRGGK